MVCKSARTSVKAVLMSMAMASVMKVFLIRKKRGTMLRKRGKGGGRRSEVASMQVKSRNRADGLECNCWNVLGRCVRSYMSVRW
jgi:hypothetical protein